VSVTRIALGHDLRFAARTAAFAAYTLGTLARFEIEARGMDADETERTIARTMLRYGRHMLGLFGVEVVAVGLPEAGFVPGRDEQGVGRIFVANHRSALDIFVTMAHLEGKHVSRADVAQWPLVGVVARRAGILFVDRSSKRSAAAVVHAMIDAVQRGRGIIIFPEGTTFAGDEVRPFKPGAFAVSRRTTCEIIPVGVAYAGAETAFEEESFLTHMRRLAGAPRTRIGLAVGEPIRQPGADPAELSNLVHARLQALVYGARRLVEPASQRPSPPWPRGT
jgi:1-acyl-sn-glycerol-3-phosphate acyltransferase